MDEALGYGKSLHDMLAELHGRAINGQTITDKLADELVQCHLRVPFAYPSLRDIMRESARGVVRDYIKARKADFDKIEFSEKAIEVSIGDGVSVSGRIDLVRRRDTNEIAIVDLKSNKDAQAPELTDNQLNIYALGYRELTGRDAHFLETYQLDKQERVSRSVHDEDIENVKTQIKATAEALRKKEFPAKPAEKSCGRCDFSRMCAAGSKYLAEKSPKSSQKVS